MRDLLINLLISIVSLGLFFGFGELIARAYYPEFANQIHTRELTGGQRVYRSDIVGLSTRIPAPGAVPELNSGDRVILVVGDSVTFGYGLPYNDTFVGVWQRRLKLKGRSEKIVSFASFGNNVVDIVGGIATLTSRFQELGVTIAAVIYQFNFNDLIPVTREDLQQKEEARGLLDRLKSGSWFARLRHKFLNYSVLLRVGSVKAASLFANSSANCEELGVSAMREYTQAFVAKGVEEAGEKSWAVFDQSMRTLAEERQFPFAIMISPLSVTVHPSLKEHQLARPPRMDCATIDPSQRLKKIARDLDFVVCDPTEYLQENFRLYRDEGNTVALYHENDSNHPNRYGSLFMGEYCFERLLGTPGALLPGNT